MKKYLVKAIAEFEIEVTADSVEEAKKIADDINPDHFDMENFEIYQAYDITEYRNEAAI